MIMKKQNSYDTLIIGGGPAGLTAAIYLLRSNIKVLLIEKDAPGGKLLSTYSVENYPGFEFIKGFELAQNFYNQTLKLNLEVKFGEIEKIIDIDKKIKKIVFKEEEDIEPIYAKTIIIASGTKAKRLDIENYDKYFGSGISTCLVCDGNLYKNQEIIVIGGGNSAIEESIYASPFLKKITIINLADKLLAFDDLVSKIQKLKNIQIINSAKSKELVIDKDNKISGLKIIDLKTQKEKIINGKGIFTYIGWIPNNSFLINSVSEKITTTFFTHGFINVEHDTQKTIIPGVFAAGDIVNRPYQQITSAVSDGTKAALSAIHYLRNIE